MTAGALLLRGLLLHGLLLRPSAAGGDAVAAIGLGAVTVGLVFAVLVVVGFAILARRSRSRRRVRPVDDVAVRADIALVRLDDDVAAATDELGFAIAQFGQAQADPLAVAITSARSTLAAAFAIRQGLDDHGPGTPLQQREGNARILLLCETASERLATERTVLDGLRSLERSGARDLAAVRDSLDRSEQRMPDAVATVARLASSYAAQAVAPITDAPTAAKRLLASARRAADEAEASVDDAGVSSIGALVRTAERDARDAERLLDAVRKHDAGLEASVVRLEALVTEVRGRVAEATRVRDDPPDPATGSAVADAIAYVQRTLASTAEGRPDPDAWIARVSATADALDTALAGARNERQRLEHARTALTGALVTARSQLETTRAYIAARRGGAGAQARTRLAEAARLLAIAEAEADPVVALDTARSSVTYSRDADALARYDLLH